MLREGQSHGDRRFGLDRLVYADRQCCRIVSQGRHVSRLPRCVPLRRLFPEGSFVGCADIMVERATDHAADVRPGDLFVARVGPRVDGHGFIREALDRGADALLVERPTAAVDVPQCVVASTNRAFAELCHALHGNPSRRLPVVGVTGTDGKTTTCWLLRSILSQPKPDGLIRPVALCGTIDIDDGLMPRPATMTTPGPMLVAEWLGRASGNGAHAAVLEVSSHALDQDRVAGVELALAVLTSFGHDHLDYHESLEAYAAAKAKVCDLLRSSGPVIASPQAVENILPHCGVRSGRVVRIGEQAESVATVRVVQEALSGMDLEVTFRGRSLTMSSPLIGIHNANNVLAAVVAAKLLGVADEQIIQGVAAMTGVPGRLESVESDDASGIHVLVDYAHTPDAIRTVLGEVTRLANGKVHVVAGAGGGRDTTKRATMGSALAGAATVTLTSDNPRDESAAEICRSMATGLADHTDVTTVVDRRDAIQAAVGRASRDDVVLILGKGHETTQTIDGEVHEFDDRVVAAEVLDSLSR